MTPKKQARSIFFGLLIFLFTSECLAHQLSFMFGPSYETIQIKNTTKSRLTVSSFLAQYERKLLENVYFSLGVTSQVDISTINVVSFGLYGSARYYLIGRPDRSESSSEGTFLSLNYPYSLFLGGGIFNKEVNFEGEERQTVGGLVFQCGGTFQYSKKFYINWTANYLYQGEKNRVSYSNIEAYVGLGFWL